MGIDGHKPQSIRNFGGLFTLTDPTNIPFWASPDCLNVEFLPGLVKSRPGTTSVYAAVGTSVCNYTKTYINAQQFVRTLNLYASGNSASLYKEDVTNTPGTESSIATNLLNSICNSTSLFTREYMAFGDGKFGVDVPRQYDDTNLDRVSQSGPGAAPNAIEENVSASIAASPTGTGQVPVANIVASPSGVSQSGYVATFVTTAAHAIGLGDTVVVAGVGVTGYNGTWVVIDVPDNTHFKVQLNVQGLAASGNGTAGSKTAFFFTTTPFPVTVGSTVTVSGVTVGGYNGTWKVRFVLSPTNFQADINSTGLASSGSGTVTVVGNITTGTHQVTVMFVDREGSITRPAAPVKFLATGNKRVVLSNIPIGPSTIVSRIVAFTPINSDSFFYLTGTNDTIASSEMVIGDNSTTTAVFDFTDALLLTGTNVDDLFDLVVLAPCAGVTSYSSRLFWWGELNQIQNFKNLSFDGGWHNSFGGSPDYPLGWTQDASFGLGGTSFGIGVAGEAYSVTPKITGTKFGKISQSAYQDTFGAAILQPNVGYSVRCRAAVFGIPNDGTWLINLSSASGGFATPGLVINFSQMPNISSGGTYANFSGVLTTPLSSIPSDLLLNVSCVTGTDQFIAFLIDEIEIYPTNVPTLATQVRASKPEAPESYSGIDGFLQPAPENGQRVTNCFTIRNIFYMVKERSLFATQDDGVSEPANWTIQEVSAKVGTPSVKGVGLGDEWATIAGESGFWYFTGGLISEQNKLSKEIQPTWDSINWAYGHLVSVAVDIERKHIYIAAPFGSSTVPNKILVLDYTEGFTEMQDGVGRKWSIWSIGASSVALVQRQDTTLQVFFGNSLGTGKVYQLDQSGTAHADDGTAFDSYWQSGFLQGPTRMNFGYISGNIVGSGNMSLTLYRGDMTNVTAIRGWLMNLFGYTNMERTIQKQAYRMSTKFECTAAAIQYFSMQGVEIWFAPAVYAPVRGINA